jgi:hypothetical protein
MARGWCILKKRNKKNGNKKEYLQKKIYKLILAKWNYFFLCFRYDFFLGFFQNEKKYGFFKLKNQVTQRTSKSNDISKNTFLEEFSKKNIDME